MIGVKELVRSRRNSSECRIIVVGQISECAREDYVVNIVFWKLLRRIDCITTACKE